MSRANDCKAIYHLQSHEEAEYIRSFFCITRVGGCARACWGGREGGREVEVVLRVWVNAVATEGMLGDLNPLGDGPCRSLADNGARVPEV